MSDREQRFHEIDDQLSNMSSDERELFVDVIPDELIAEIFDED